MLWIFKNYKNYKRAQAILIHARKSRPEKHLPPAESKAQLAAEMADVVGMMMVSAHVYGIDLEAALKAKWIDRD